MLDFLLHFRISTLFYPLKKLYTTFLQKVLVANRKKEWSIDEETLCEGQSVSEHGEQRIKKVLKKKKNKQRKKQLVSDWDLECLRVQY